MADREKEFNPWERLSSAYHPRSSDEEYAMDRASKRPKFLSRPGNNHLDINTKIAALKASSSVVSLVSFSGENELSQGSGTIIECEKNNNIVITSANLIRRQTSDEEEYVEDILADNLKIIVHASDETSYEGEIYAYDFHYNLVAVVFKTNTPFKSATLRMLDDSLGLIKSEAETSFLLRRHAPKIRPGDPIFAVGRYFCKPFEFMAAPGRFSVDSADPSQYGCRELAMSSCSITKCGDGSAMLNLDGEVIGVAYYDLGCFAPFLPINIVWKWWEHYKINKELRHPFLGFEATNFYTADLSTIERIMKRFPTISKGVIVEEVVAGSSAFCAGLRHGDIIIKCGGIIVECFLQLWEVFFNNVGEYVELEVVRLNSDSFLSLKMEVVEATKIKFNRCPVRNYF